MDGMTPAHAKDNHRRDSLLPVLALILLGGLLEVWASWLQIGAVSGFPHLGRVTTGWILPVTAEAYWGSALWAWLVDPAGKASRLFAMWSAAAVFVLSLLGQESDHLMAFAGRTAPPVGAAMILTALPLTTIALGAILIHLRQRDRDSAAAAGRERAETERRAAGEAAAADERTALRAELEALRAGHGEQIKALASELEAERTARADAEKRASESLTRAEALAKKLTAVSDSRKRGKTPQGTRKTSRDEDLTTEFRALDEMQKDPALRGPRMGAELARRLGVSPATGNRLHAKLTAHGAAAESLTERSADPSGERS